jgi:Ca2+-binding RTX toxin-like protein
MLQTQPYFTAFTIDGTDAAETITFTDTSTRVNAGEGVNTITGTSGNNYIISGGGADTIAVTSGHNTILAGAGANTITATLGNNVITSGDGADTITVTSGNNTINAGGGANTIVATSGINEINTGDGADTITTGGVAGGGNTINAGDGANTITSGAGDDTITGGSGADTISAGDGNNVVTAGNGANTVTTGSGNDIVYSGVDTDTITTGAGDDVIHIKGGTDTIAAGAGNDTLIVDFSSATGAVSINTLAGNAAAGYAGNISGLGIATFAGVENFEITSGDFNDTITTGDGNDVVHAGAGNDIVNLGGGDDEAIYTLASNYGATDVYLGGAGNDTLTLEFTADEWNNNTLVQSEIARYQAHLVDDSSDEFHFVSGLTVSEFENLSVRIGDGDAVDMTVAPVDDVPYGNLLALAFMNIDGEAGYNPESGDLLIASIEDTNGDSRISAGDIFRTGVYPLSTTDLESRANFEIQESILASASHHGSRADGKLTSGESFLFNTHVETSEHIGYYGSITFISERFSLQEYIEKGYNSISLIDEFGTNPIRDGSDIIEWAIDEWAMDQAFIYSRGGSDANNFPLLETQKYTNDTSSGLESIGDSQFLDVWLA